MPVRLAFAVHLGAASALCMKLGSKLPFAAKLTSLFNQELSLLFPNSFPVKLLREFHRKSM